MEEAGAVEVVTIGNKGMVIEIKEEAVEAVTIGNKEEGIGNKGMGGSVDLNVGQMVEVASLADQEAGTGHQ